MLGYCGSLFIEVFAAITIWHSGIFPVAGVSSLLLLLSYQLF